MNSSIRISFVGGCHVGGYLVGLENAFSRQSSEKLNACGIKNCIDTHVVYRFRKALALEKILNDSSPDVLVVQLGTFEAGPTILHGKFGSKKKNMSADMADQFPYPVDATFKLNLHYKIKFLVKQAIHRLLRYRLLDDAKLQHDIECFMSAVAQLGVAHVVMLSPLPSFDPAFKVYRTRVGKMMNDAAREQGLEITDIRTLLDGRKDLYLPDGVHLNTRGHESLARIVAEKIKSELERTSLGEAKMKDLRQLVGLLRRSSRHTQRNRQGQVFVEQDNLRKYSGVRQSV
jgi:hypothetical protein